MYALTITYKAFKRIEANGKSHYVPCLRSQTREFDTLKEAYNSFASKSLFSNIVSVNILKCENLSSS